jgi:hypothetical protein
MRWVFRTKQTTIATKSVGMEGGFYSKFLSAEVETQRYSLYLYQKPSRRFCSVAEDVKETPYLPQYF